MANPIKHLAGQTAIYGLSTIVGRLLNYLLVPIHVALFQPEAYGVVTELYAYAAFFAVILTYGMETAFFRYLNKDGISAETTFKTAFSSLFLTTGIFVTLCYVLNYPIAKFMLYESNPEYIVYFALILGMDALSALPMAKLRAENKAIRFASINLINIGIVIVLNLFFLVYCKNSYENDTGYYFVKNLYDPAIGIGYIFIANLIGSMTKFGLLLPTILSSKGRFDASLLKTMLAYGFPLLFFGLAGIVNETADRILLRRLLNTSHGEDFAKTQVGIYGANYKLAALITIFIGAFRYAAEPFFFSHEKKKDSRATYAYIMQVFAAVLGTIFLVVTLFMDLFKHIIIPNESYWEGLKVVPILLMANIFLGLYYNLGVWFKLSENTRKGMYISVFGAIFTIGLNLIFIPKYMYMASAWVTFAVYAGITVVSYLMGRKYYPIPYKLGRIAMYIVIPPLIYLLLQQLTINNIFIKYGLHSLILLTFVGLAYRLEFRSLPKKNR